MAGFRTAGGLMQLFRDIDAVAPQRSRRLDGTIGDAIHEQRESDHNPDGNGVVRAIDVTHDPNGGADMAVIAEQLRARRDSRTKYIIFNRRIASRRSDWQWRAFGGQPHTDHMHVSAVGDARADDTSSWGLHAAGPQVRTVPQVEGLGATPAEIVPDQRDAEVLVLQELMIRIGLIRDTVENRDMFYGPAMVKVIREFQAKHGLFVDGRVGPNTWRVLRSFDPTG